VEDDVNTTTNKDNNSGDKNEWNYNFQHKSDRYSTIT
jgi:hypothetical protein